MEDSKEYWFSETGAGPFVFGLLFSVFGGVVRGFGYMIELTHPEDNMIWIVNAAAYAMITIGVLSMLFRRRGLLDGYRHIYIREWGFGFMFSRNHIPFHEFSHVLIEGVKPSMRTVYQVSLARKQDRIGRFDRTDIGDEGARKIAERAEQADMIGTVATALKAATSSHQPGGFVLYGICSFIDPDTCRSEAEEIARLVGVPIHERIGDGNTTIRTVD